MRDFNKYLCRPDNPNWIDALHTDFGNYEQTREAEKYGTVTLCIARDAQKTERLKLVEYPQPFDVDDDHFAIKFNEIVPPQHTQQISSAIPHNQLTTLAKPSTHTEEFVDTRNDQEILDFLQSSGILSHAISETVRELIVCFHAQGWGTTKAVRKIATTPEWIHNFPFARWSADLNHTYFFTRIAKNVGYLKISHQNFPKKYHELWTSARSQYIQQIHAIPLSQSIERYQEASNLYIHLKEKFENATDPREIETLHKCLLRTLAYMEMTEKTFPTSST